jgi:predicted CXXCH cytochrome family protein
MAAKFFPVGILIVLASGLGHAPLAQESRPLDAIVVGAGLSGLSAAIEMGRAGVHVLVVDMNSVAGGHAVLAGGVALVGTPVQEKAGVKDSPGLAVKDWMEWTRDGDEAWTRFYAENSRSMIYDWVTAMGVEFVRAGSANGNSVPRFHFTKGRALHLVMPMFKTALALPTVSFLWNARAERLVVEGGAVRGVEIRHLRDGRTETLRAAHTVLATGGFESDLDRVLGNWTPGLPRPDRLLIGSAISATGSGHDMATAAGAALSRIDRHYIYIDGLRDPRDPEGIHALTGGNGRSMWVNAQGRRFTNESGWDKQILVDLLNQKPASYWAIFDESARGAFGVRGAAWVSTPMPGHPILDNPRSAHKAQSLSALAAMAGLPADALAASVARFNHLIASGNDADFGRFKAGDRLPATITTPPFYAVQFFPMTRKNMGGVAIDQGARVQNREGRTVPGLYAAGELTGSVGINGSHGMDGMFLGPAILTGRLAGSSIVEAQAGTRPAAPRPEPAAPAPGTASAGIAALSAADLEPLLSTPRNGYWHFERVHKTVVEREYACTRCHSAALPPAPLVTREQRSAQTEICVNCH